MFRVVMFDDRNTEHYIEAIKCTSVEEGIQKGRQYIDDFKDCDDGTTPRHLDYRVEVVFYRTTVYDDAEPDIAIEVFECEKELTAVHKAKTALKTLRCEHRLPMGRFTFRLERLWKEVL